MPLKKRLQEQAPTIQVHTMNIIKNKYGHKTQDSNIHEAIGNNEKLF